MYDITLCEREAAIKLSLVAAAAAIRLSFVAAAVGTHYILQMYRISVLCTTGHVK